MRYEILNYPKFKKSQFGSIFGSSGGAFLCPDPPASYKNGRSKIFYDYLNTLQR